MIIESIKTGDRHVIPAEQWDDMRKNGDARKYRVISQDAGNTEIEVPKVDPVIQNVIEASKTVYKPTRKSKPKKA